MPAYHIERRIKIQATADKVRPVVEDFGEWPKWSPWLCMEPSAELTYQGNPGETGHGYHWKGTLVGEGGMQMSGISENTYDMKLDFIIPSFDLSDQKRRCGEEYVLQFRPSF